MSITAPPRATAPELPEPEGEHLQAALQQRHLTMIALGGVIGAGLFVGSGAVISVTGPAAVLSYVLAGGLVGIAPAYISPQLVLSFMSLAAVIVAYEIRRRRGATTEAIARPEPAGATP